VGAQGAEPFSPGFLQRSNSQASRHDALAARLAGVEKAFEAALAAASGAAEDGLESLLDELGSVGQSGAMDEVRATALWSLCYDVRMCELTACFFVPMLCEA